MLRLLDRSLVCHVIGACAAVPNRDAGPFGAVPTGAALVGCSGRVACEHSVESCVHNMRKLSAASTAEARYGSMRVASFMQTA